MVVVDEVDEPVVDALVVGHVGERRVDTDRLGEHLGQRPPGAQEIVVDRAGAALIASEDAVSERGIERTGGTLTLRRRLRPRRHQAPANRRGSVLAC